MYPYWTSSLYTCAGSNYQTDDPGLGKMLSVLYLVVKKKGCSQEEKEWTAKPPVAKQVGEGGWVWG